jgi:methionyl-tRNA formyltransferase
MEGSDRRLMENSSPSILFMGTPSFAATALLGLLRAGFNVVGVVTRPDTNKGRSGSKSPSEVKLEAIKHKIPIYQPGGKEELVKMAQDIQPELIVVAAYGMIIPQRVLDIPKYGALNIHGSLLPKYRGASPISEAILNGDDETGITIMKMSAGMDEGDIIEQKKLPILSPLCHPYESEDILGQAKDDNEEYDTTATLTIKMAHLGAKAIVETIPGWVSGELEATPQDDVAVTYCRKITKEDGHIDWSKSAIEIERMVRAYTPWPTAYTFVDEKRIKVLSSRHCEEHGDAPARLGGAISSGTLQFQNNHIYVATGAGTLEVLELQPEGKKPMSAKDFINGNKELNGKKLG